MRIREALQAQGFGVLTEIDVQATLRDKLGQDMEDYLIQAVTMTCVSTRDLSQRMLARSRSVVLLSGLAWWLSRPAGPGRRA